MMSSDNLCCHNMLLHGNRSLTRIDENKVHVHVLNDYQPGSSFESVFPWHSSGPEFDPTTLLAHSFMEMVRKTFFSY